MIFLLFFTFFLQIYLMISLSSICHIWIWTLKENKKKWLDSALSICWLWSYSIVWYDVDTWVSQMPLTSEETIEWSINRARNCFLVNPSLDFACGAEWWVFFTKPNKAYMIWAITLLDASWYMNTSTWWDVLLPESVAQRLRNGEELWVIMDDIRQTEWANHRDWAMWFFTKWAITRGQAFEYMTMNALVPWLHSTLYS